MTDVGLQNHLIERTKKLLGSQSLKRLDGVEWMDFNVYRNEIPVKDDYNDIFEQNYIVIIIGDEDENEDGSWQVEIQYIIGYNDEDDNRQGHIVNSTLMNEIYMDLVKHGAVGNKYDLLHKSKKRFADQHREGFYESALICYWQIPGMIQEELRELV